MALWIHALALGLHTTTSGKQVRFHDGWDVLGGHCICIGRLVAWNARRGVFDSEHLDELHYGSLPDIGSDRCVSVEIQLYSGQWIVVIASG